MEQADKQGYEAFRSNYHHLMNVDPNEIVDLCFAKKLVSRRQMEEINAARVGHGNFKACEKLLQALMGNGEEKVFQTFIEVLESKSHLGHLANRLRGECVCVH